VHDASVAEEDPRLCPEHSGFGLDPDHQVARARVGYGGRRSVVGDHDDGVLDVAENPPPAGPAEEPVAEIAEAVAVSEVIEDADVAATADVPETSAGDDSPADSGDEPPASADLGIWSAATDTKGE